MTQLTTKDKEFLRIKLSDTFNRLRDDWGSWKHTLKSYIQELADIVNLQIEAKIHDFESKDISSYLNRMFVEDGHPGHDDYIRECLPSNFKGNYSRSELNTDLNESVWVTVSSDNSVDLIQKDQFNDFRVNGDNYTKLKPKIKPEDQEPVREITAWDLNNTTKTIYALEQTGSLIERIAHHFREDYMNNREILDKAFHNKLDFYHKQYAKHSNAKKAIDERGKWGDYEKIMSKFLMETGETTARMAELLNYSSKYGSIGIDRHGEFVDEQTKQFKKELLEFLMICPLCAKNIYHKLNEEIEKYRLGVELKLRPAI